ncbi:MAG: class I SAM-dependent methyltransferase [bacterium]
MSRPHPGDSRFDQRRLYGDLAWIWPLISPPQDYVEEAECLCQAIGRCARIPVRSLLDLGCGGGHNDATLKRHFSVTGVDISPSMLSMAKSLNPEIPYLQGDMRSLRLEQRFDAVLIADSIAYMCSEEDLLAAFDTAFFHLKAGGVLVTYAEQTQESFQQNRTTVSTHRAGEREITFIENLFDPDPSDTTYEMTFLYLIRQAGVLEIETDRHIGGLFPRQSWLLKLREAGFEVEVKLGELSLQIPLFAGVRLR